MTIDLRSDTLTKPDEAMRAAMANAPVGDDVYGEDPTVNSLEERVAAMFGKEAGLFTPTGSLSNQLALRTLVKPGEELLSESFSHIVRAELGAAAALSGITTRTWLDPDGQFSADRAIAIAHPDAGPYLVSTKAFAVENTHNFGGGTVQNMDEVKKLRAYADGHNLTMHLDGARIWNAHIASGISFIEYGKYFETISVCFSKGLGAPVGSMMVADKKRIDEARIWRKRHGAGMRQVGILAAAAHYALDNNMSDLKQDHDRALRLAKTIAAKNSSVLDAAKVHTNIVALNLSSTSWSAPDLAKKLKDEGIIASALGPTFLRLVTHRDLSDTDVDTAASVIASLL